ncbi:MAG TPA: SDR family NAD(P)-dependent oxidoreductase [Actinoplanes sp.]
MGQRILITGARRGIGAAIAVGLSRPGTTLLLHRLGAAEEAYGVARLCDDLGAGAELVEADLADADAVRKLASRAGPVDVLINNAARVQHRPRGAAIGRLAADVRGERDRPDGDLVATVRLLVSDGSGALTGQVLEVGGGLIFR